MAVCSICGYSVTDQHATLCEVRFIVYGRDGSAFDYGPNDRHEAHQAYMDAWLSHLIARGPTLSSDGEDHTGSVHVIEVDNADIARGFAYREPYAQAGWYAEVSVTPMVPAVDGTMWDHPRPAGDQVSSFLRASWPARPLEDVASVRRRLAESNPPWLFAGLLLTDDQESTSGMAAAVDLSPSDATDQLRACLDFEEVEVHRWTRGGGDS
jgi:uncharacterized protein